MRAFYAKTLGLRLVSEDDFALAFDAGGTRLRVAIVKTLQPAGYTVLGWIVPDIAKAVRELLKRGVIFSPSQKIYVFVPLKLTPRPHADRLSADTSFASSLHDSSAALTSSDPFRREIHA